MKIGIACYPTHGGSGVVASELAIGLAKTGHQVHIISYATPFRIGGFYENLYVHEVEVASYPLFKYPPYALSLATKLVDVAQEYDLDLVHSHYAVPHAASAYLAKKILTQKRLKTITTLHGTDITLVGVDKSFFQVIKFVIDESDGVTAVSNYLRRRTLEDFGISREIQVIHNFVDISRFRPGRGECIRERFAPKGEKILIHASNFRPVKRVGDAVKVFAGVRHQLPAKLLLVGEGPDRIAVQQLVKELSLSDDVLFLGEQDYLENLLSCSDLLLLPSGQESFGLVALEAHSCGVPVIGTDTGGLPEVVVDGKTGFLLPLGGIDQMSEKAVALLSDSAMLASFRERGRKRAVDHFESSRLVGEYVKFYERILAD